MAARDGRRTVAGRGATGGVPGWAPDGPPLAVHAGGQLDTEVPAPDRTGTRPATGTARGGR
jgi:hypothetical protein